MNKTTKVFLRLSLGIIFIFFTAAILLYIVPKVINIKDYRLLSWLYLLICLIGFYFAGLINRKTKLVFNLFLLTALLIFIPLKQFYFPFFFSIILFSLVSLMLARNELHTKVKIISIVLLIVVFGIYLFSQPLIIKNKGFTTDADNNLYNATVLWDFTPNSFLSLPDEIFKDENGNDVRLKKFEGKIAYITFWASWCSICRKERPELEAFKKKYQDNKAIVFIDISIDKNTNSWKNYLSKNEQIGIQLLSENLNKTGANYKFIGIPYHIIVDPEGNFKEIKNPSSIDHELLTNPIKLTEYMNTTYKVFKTIKINDNDTILRVR